MYQVYQAMMYSLYQRPREFFSDISFAFGLGIGLERIWAMASFAERSKKGWFIAIFSC